MSKRRLRVLSVDWEAVGTEQKHLSYWKTAWFHNIRALEMLKILKKSLVQLVVIVSATPSVLPQTINPAGSYVYKTYREGKGGFVNSLEISKAAGGKFHVSFEGTYLYMAGQDETFH